MDRVEKEVDAMGQPNANGCPAAPDDVHGDVPTKLYPVLALVVLSVYEYSHRGNIPRMRARANQALTVAMDISIHNLGPTASEAFRRAWWSTVGLALPYFYLLCSLTTIRLSCHTCHPLRKQRCDPIVRRYG